MIDEETENLIENDEEYSNSKIQDQKVLNGNI
jgi:hypothetical protein